MDEQKTHIQSSSEQTKLNEASAQIVKGAGGQVHHEDDHAQQAATQVATQTNSPQPSVPHDQFVDPTTSQPSQVQAQPQQKESLLDAILGIFSLKWFKTNMRNKYGEDINRVRSTREAEKSAHMQKGSPQKYTPQPSTPQPPVQPQSAGTSDPTPVASQPPATPPQQIPKQETQNKPTQTQN